MKAGWRKSDLSNVCSLITRGISPIYVNNGGITVLNQKCIRNHKIDPVYSRRHDIGARAVSAEKLLQVGDGLINSTGTGTLGRVAVVTEALAQPLIVDSHITIVRPREGVFSEGFFKYVLISLEDQLKESGDGCGGQTELSRTAVGKDFQFSFPIKLAEQDRIVSVLDNTLAEVEEAKRTTEGLLGSATELYSSFLEDNVSNKGGNWHGGLFKDVCSIENGSQPPKSLFRKEPEADNIRLIQIRDYKSDDHAVYIAKKYARSICSKDDVMIGRYGPPVFQILRGLDGAYNVALMKAVPDENRVSKDFLFYFLNGRSLRRLIVSESERASGQTGIRKDLLENYPFSYPSLETQQQIVVQLKAMRAKVLELEHVVKAKLSALDEIKRSLLHQAFSGNL